MFLSSMKFQPVPDTPKKRRSEPSTAQLGAWPPAPSSLPPSPCLLHILGPGLCRAAVRVYKLWLDPSFPSRLLHHGRSAPAAQPAACCRRWLVWRSGLQPLGSFDAAHALVFNIDTQTVLQRVCWSSCFVSFSAGVAAPCLELGRHPETPAASSSTQTAATFLLCTTETNLTHQTKHCSSNNDSH